MPTQRQRKLWRARASRYYHRQTQPDPTEVPTSFHNTFLYHDPRLLPTTDQPPWSIIDDLREALDANPTPRQEDPILPIPYNDEEEEGAPSPIIPIGDPSDSPSDAESSGGRLSSPRIFTRRTLYRDFR